MASQVKDLRIQQVRSLDFLRTDLIWMLIQA
jgi:hypothetical protein